MLKSLGLSGKLYIGFGCVVFIAAALGVFAYTRLLAINASSTIITKDCLPGVLAIGKINSLAKDNMRWTTATFLADNKAEVAVEEDKVKENMLAMEKTLKEYESTITYPKDRELFEAIKAPMEALRKARTVVFELNSAGKMKEAEVALKSDVRPANANLEEGINALIDFNTENSDKESVEITSAVTSAKSGIVIGLALAIALGAFIGIFLSRSIAAALNQVITSLSAGSEQVSSASSQVSQSSQQMAEGASEQASSLEETSASLEEMSSMTKQNSENSRQANVMATETRTAVEKSREAMNRMGDAIVKIKGSSDQTAKIIKTIDEIAFQTNLLALNAAVEAARAGDAGKGFAVVAEEVRNLAQRSAEAAKTTASLIEESQQNANNGVSVSNEVAGILTQIVESVSKLAQLIGEVSAASDEQSKGIEQIGTAVTQMDKLTQSNAANAEESASASEELAAQAKELGDMVQVLVGIVKGAGARGEAISMASAGPKSVSRPTAPAVRKAPVSAASKPVSRNAHGKDWSPAGSNGKPAHIGRNGHARVAVSSNGHALNSDQVIPMDDSDMKDF
ncbi:MAG: methyl-accepting chemotaxis sensory transducer [Fibrobacteres bacterium]|nr:methyl-accepting chemotaxis sensory transducer [Fibrobacterota bacterium]